jgi:hypothetical protein
MRTKAILIAAAVLVAAATPLTRLSAQWTIASTPRLVIGAVSGNPDQELNQIQGLTRLSTGEVVVLNDWRLRFYDARGSLLRSVGGQGDGPGEFRGNPRLYRGQADTLVVWEPLSFRRTTFDRHGTLISVETLP